MKIGGKHHRIAFALYARSWVVVTTLIVLARSVGKRVVLIVLSVSALYVTEQGENTIRIAFALSVAGWGSHSIQHRYPQHLLIRRLIRWSIA